MTYLLKRTGRTWSIVDVRGVVVEGGFFSREAAERALESWRARSF